MLLDDEACCAYQASGWHLNCAVVGSVPAAFSRISRIDTSGEKPRGNILK